MIKAERINNRTGQYEFDTGAQVHTTNKLWRLTNLKPGRTITACNGTKTTALHEGTLRMRHNKRNIILKNILYHSSFYNLISGQRIKGDFDIQGRGATVNICINGEVLYLVERDNAGTMWIKPDDEPTKTTDTYVPVNKVTLMDLHERHGHISFDTLKTLPEVASKYHGKIAPKCKACIAGKSVKSPAKVHNGSNGKTTQPRTERPLERLHADLIGPFSKEWLGKKYVLTAMDDYTRYCAAIPIKAKSDTKRALKEWIRMLENRCSPQKVVQLQADWGGEFRNTELSSWCKKKGIQLKETVPHHSETNATIERLNRTHQDMARTAMISAGVKRLWGDAIQWAAYTKNRIAHKALNSKSPLEALILKIIKRSNLRPFGQKVMIHIYKNQRNTDRMAPRAEEARIMAYTETYGVYQTIPTTTKKRQLATNPRPIDKENKEREDENSEWPRKPIQDFEDIADWQRGSNYGWHCPENEGCPKGTHPKNPEIPPDSPSQQLFCEQTEPPSAPQKQIAYEPIGSERMGRDVTNWQDRIKQGLAGGPTVSRVGHDEDHSTDEQARICPKAHEWAKARQIEGEKLQQYGVYSVISNVPEGVHPHHEKKICFRTPGHVPRRPVHPGRLQRT